MNLDELISRYDELLQGFDPLILDETTNVAQDGLVLVDRRITREGLNAKGSPLPDYSPGYKLEKKRAGKYRGIVDLTFTGQMWRETQIVSAVSQGSNAVVTIAGTTPHTRAKMEGNADLRGDFLELSDKEVEILIDDSRERLFGTINRRFE